MSFCNKKVVERLVAVLRNINNNRFFPTEQEVTDRSTNYHAQTKPHIVRHEDQHQQKAYCHLHEVKEGLINVHD